MYLDEASRGKSNEVIRLDNEFRQVDGGTCGTLYAKYENTGFNLAGEATVLI